MRYAKIAPPCSIGYPSVSLFDPRQHGAVPIVEMLQVSDTKLQDSVLKVSHRDSVGHGVIGITPGSISSFRSAEDSPGGVAVSPSIHRRFRCQEMSKRPRNCTRTLNLRDELSQTFPQV